MIYKICGTVKIQDELVSRKVLLFKETTLSLEATQQSDLMTGFFQFIVLDNTSLYTVVILPNPDELTVNAKVLSHLTAIPV